MKTTEIPLGVFATLLPLASTLLLGQDPQEPRAPAPGSNGLQRVAPAPGGADRDLAQIFSRDFDRDSWRELLTTPDLGLREGHFDVLVKRAGFDPNARAFLEELSRDPKGGELAWTARLALREIGRARFPLSGFLPGADPFGMGADPLHPGSSLEGFLRDLMDQEGRGSFLLPPTMPRQPGALSQGGTGAAGRSVHVEQTEKGARVEIAENVGGQEQERTFEGSSLEEILKQNPELQEELGDLRIRVDAGSPLDLDFGFGTPWNLGRGRSLGRAQDPRQVPQQATRPLRTDKLGVKVVKLAPERARELQLLEGQGLLVERCYPGTYAYLLGVGSGDILLELDGKALKELEDIELVMRGRDPEAELKLDWIDQFGQRQAKTWRPEKEEK